MSTHFYVLNLHYFTLITSPFYFLILVLTSNQGLVQPHLCVSRKFSVEAKYKNWDKRNILQKFSELHYLYARLTSWLESYLASAEDAQAQEIK